MSIDVLVGREILIVEDDYFCASEMKRALATAGSKVLGPVSTAEEAHNIIENNPPFAAVLDAKIIGGFSFPVADSLAASGTPFIFVSGYDRSDVPGNYQDFIWVLKPAEMSNVLRQLVTAIGHAEPRKGILNLSHVNRAG